MTDPSNPGASRRQLLRGALALAGAAPAGLVAAASPVSLDGSPARTPLAQGHGIVTPAELHFARHHRGIPAVERARQRLVVGGMVKHPRAYTMAEIERFPAVSRFLFIECARNGLNAATVQQSHGLTGTAEWTGVPLSALLRAAGVAPGAGWLSAAGADGVTRGLPLAKAWRDALLAYGQTGAPLRRAQGFPLRLIVPGWQGHTHVKWLCRLEVAERPRRAVDDLVMPAQSVITFPSGGMILPGPGGYEISGLAWSGRGRVERVEVSTNGGLSWALAALQEPVLPGCHTRFRHPWRWDGGPAVLQSRCRDETGDAQPERGPARNRIQSWRVAADGGVGKRHD